MRTTLILRIGIVALLALGGGLVFIGQLLLAQCGYGCSPEYSQMAQKILGSYAGPFGLSVAAVLFLFQDKNAAAEAPDVRSAAPAILALLLASIFVVWTASGPFIARYGSFSAANLAAIYSGWPVIIGAGLTATLALLAHKKSDG